MYKRRDHQHEAEDEVEEVGWSGAPGRVTCTSRLPPSAASIVRAVVAQLRAGGGPAVTRDPLASAARGIEGGGAPMPHLAAIQAAFGRHDVSSVRAHVGGAAEVASRELGAVAYASGDRIAFAREPDLFLVAHEAAHVVQQRGGVQLAGGVGHDGDPHEQHADLVARAVVRGESAEALLDRYAGGGGAAAVQCHPGDHAHPHSAVRTEFPWLRPIVVTSGVMSGADADRWIDGLSVEEVRVLVSVPVEPSPEPGRARPGPDTDPSRPPQVVGQRGGGGARARPSTGVDRAPTSRAARRATSRPAPAPRASRSATTSTATATPSCSAPSAPPRSSGSSRPSASPNSPGSRMPARRCTRSWPAATSTRSSIR